MIIEDLKKTTMGLQEVVDSLNAEMEEDFDPSEWSGGNFDDCYELGYSHGKKVGRLAAYKEILKMYEQHQQKEAQQKWEDWSKNKKTLDKEIEVLMESTQQVLRRKI
ncbi:hypothetical protein G9G63_09100 [Paenibacillus sp. EKM202P]|uniref:hypothetical protein n=1 Tax=unclassified Paenibacillus TaxID=185978 RepID=UPI0013EA8F3B|nr:MULTISPECIES: hypothetical protein [unclassified Paenibacillus]KAF6565306.1 hypothetical protein G9G63_09100 [Paenibacillus sp. EKM202P]KAF6569368.1 hypothetical protein G9G64_12990 [Paenibacillus sp. EKM207P]